MPSKVLQLIDDVPANGALMSLESTLLQPVRAVASHALHAMHIGYATACDVPHRSSTMTVMPAVTHQTLA